MLVNYLNNGGGEEWSSRVRFPKGNNVDLSGVSRAAARKSAWGPGTSEALGLQRTTRRGLLVFTP